MVLKKFKGLLIILAALVAVFVVYGLLTIREKPTHMMELGLLSQQVRFTLAQVLAVS